MILLGRCLKQAMWVFVCPWFYFYDFYIHSICAKQQTKFINLNVYFSYKLNIPNESPTEEERDGGFTQEVMRDEEVGSSVFATDYFCFRNISSPPSLRSNISEDSLNMEVSLHVSADGLKSSLGLPGWVVRWLAEGSSLCPLCLWSCGMVWIIPPPPLTTAGWWVGVGW